MRVILTLFWTLILLWLCSVHAAGPAQPRCVVSTAASMKGWPETVRGLGLTAQEAKKDAFEEARKAIKTFLENQRPPLRSWQPARDYIEQHLLAEEKPGADIVLEDLAVAKSWLLTLRTPNLKDLQQLDHKTWIDEREKARKARTPERVLLLGKITLGALALLSLVFGGVRLSEKIQTRYARFVVAGMIGVAAACIVVGLLLV